MEEVSTANLTPNTSGEDQDWKAWAQRAAVLWDLLDHIDTMSDQLRPARDAFFEAVMETIKKRHLLLRSDGHTLRPYPNGERPVPVILNGVQEGGLQAAVRQAILVVLCEPLSIASLQRISQLCRGGITLLGPGHPRYGRHQFAGAIGYDDGGELIDMPGGGIVASPFNSENFGVQVIREAIAMFTDLKKQEKRPDADLFSMTMAIEHASKLGMPDVVEKLKGELREKLGVQTAPIDVTGEDDGAPAAEVHGDDDGAEPAEVTGADEGAP